MKCPYCNSLNTKKAGKYYKNTQRYKCNDCEKYFLESTFDVFYHTNFKKEDLELVLNEMLTSKEAKINFTNRTKREYKYLIFEYLKFYYSKVKLYSKVIIYDSSFSYVASNKRHINTLLVSLISEDNTILISLNNPKLRKKNLRLYVEPFLTEDPFIIFEKYNGYLDLIYDLHLKCENYWNRLDELMVYDVFYDNKVALKGLKEYLKTVPFLTKENISNYVRFYNYFLQVKGSVKEKIDYMINSQNFKDFIKNYAKSK